jgi:hypothetical protein
MGDEIHRIQTNRKIGKITRFVLLMVYTETGGYGNARFSFLHKLA